VRLHHAKGLLDPQAECTSHTLSDMTAQGTVAMELPACTPPSSTPWHASRAASRSSSSSC
jgi:hypothetical protein